MRFCCLLQAVAGQKGPVKLCEGNQAAKVILIRANTFQSRQVEQEAALVESVAA